LADYAQERGPEVASPWRIAAAIKALVPFWQARTVADVTRETCRAFVAARDRSPGTARRELGVLRAAINHALREGRITRTVAVHFPERPEPRDRWLTRSEAAALLLASLRERRVRLYLPLFILIGLYTGQRKQAILSLRWSQVDLNNARVDFNSPGARRTNKRRARIPIPNRLLPHLRRSSSSWCRTRLCPPRQWGANSGRQARIRFRVPPSRTGERNPPHSPAHVRNLADAARSEPLGCRWVPRHEPRNIGTGVRSPPP
jgi:integrase